MLVLLDKTGTTVINQAIIGFYRYIDDAWNLLIQDEKFQFDKFFWEGTKESAKEQYEKFLVETDIVIEIRPWKPRNPWSAAIATTFAGDKNIYINMRKINSFTGKDYAATLSHECSHLAGFHHRSKRTGWRKVNDNVYTDYKAYSVPYALSNIWDKLNYVI
jgi:hypothetical protein